MKSSLLSLAFASVFAITLTPSLPSHAQTPDVGTAKTQSQATTQATTQTKQVPKKNVPAFNLRAGSRISYRLNSSQEDQQSNFELRNATVFANFYPEENLSSTLSVDVDSDQDRIQLIDAVIKYRHSQQINLWAGQLLIPTDRDILSGPYFQSTFEFQRVRRYPSRTIGRDLGLAIWGSLTEHPLNYYFGVFNGITNDDNANNPSDVTIDESQNLYSIRLAWDWGQRQKSYLLRNGMLVTGYHHSLAASCIFQDDVFIRPSGATQSYRACSTDYHLNVPTQQGQQINVQASYHDYELDDIRYSFLQSGTGTNLLAAYGFRSQQAFWWQVYSRYNLFDGDSADEIRNVDVGLNLIAVKGNTSLSLFRESTTIQGETNNSLKLGFRYFY